MQMQACAPFLLFTAKLLTRIGWRVRIIGREGPKISQFPKIPKLDTIMSSSLQSDGKY
jgi:hypothetical protein